ncbi:MAG: GIY-YIG nuclease family protein [Stellaceae bacterium]
MAAASLAREIGNSSLSQAHNTSHPEERPTGPRLEGRTPVMSAYLYILRCADGAYYTGTTRTSLDCRVAEHQAGAFDGYTALRRPIELVFHQEFQRIEDAIAAERQVKGWRREKKEALICGKFVFLPELARRGARSKG